MTPPVSQVINELRKEIELEDAKTERACEKLLSNIPRVLLPTLNGTITYVDHQQMCSAGIVDVIVIADVVQLGGDTRREAYVWELKAPQLHLFKIETSDRACPTPELFSAENQLLHYHSAMSRDEHFRDRWGISSSYQISFGGIIMGRNSTLVRYTDEQSLYAPELANQAFRIRKKYFYEHASLHLWTWDHVLEIAESLTFSHQKITGDPSASMNLKITSVAIDAILVQESVKE
jgi:hypothetical protein